jgi:hypothetical protein
MGDSLWRTRASEGTRTSEKVETSEREETGEREISSVTKTQDSLRLSLSVLKKDEDTSSGREAFILILRPPTSTSSEKTFLPRPLLLRASNHTDAYTGLQADSYTNTPDFSGKDVYQGMLRIPTPLLAELTRGDNELREWPP